MSVNRNVSRMGACLLAFMPIIGGFAGCMGTLEDEVADEATDTATEAYGTIIRRPSPELAWFYVTSIPDAVQSIAGCPSGYIAYMTDQGMIKGAYMSDVERYTITAWQDIGFGVSSPYERGYLSCDALNHLHIVHAGTHWYENGLAFQPGWRPPADRIAWIRDDTWHFERSSAVQITVRPQIEFWSLRDALLYKHTPFDPPYEEVMGNQYSAQQMAIQLDPWSYDWTNVYVLHSNRTLWRGTGRDSDWQYLGTPHAARLITQGPTLNETPGRGGRNNSGGLWALNDDNSLWYGRIYMWMEAETPLPPPATPGVPAAGTPLANACAEVGATCTPSPAATDDSRCFAPGVACLPN